MATLGQSASIKARLVLLASPSTPNEPEWVNALFRSIAGNVADAMNALPSGTADIGRITAGIDALQNSRTLFSHGSQLTQIAMAVAVVQPHPAPSQQN